MLSALCSYSSLFYSSFMPYSDYYDFDYDCYYSFEFFAMHQCTIRTIMHQHLACRINSVHTFCLPMILAVNRQFICRVAKIASDKSAFLYG